MDALKTGGVAVNTICFAELPMGAQRHVSSQPKLSNRQRSGICLSKDADLTSTGFLQNSAVYAGLGDSKLGLFVATAGLGRHNQASQSSISSTTGLSSVPIGSIVTDTQSPARRRSPLAMPTPAGVPVDTISPGSNVIYCEVQAMISAQE